MLRGTLAAVVVLLVFGPVTAPAHGPCGCLSPGRGPPGTEVHASYPLYKVVFNPDRADLAIGPETLWKAHHGGPPVTVFRRTWRHSRRPLNDGATFVVPRVEPGRYLVALYDGSEGGAHYSWETFTVVGGNPEATQPAPTRGSSSNGVSVPLFVGAVFVALAGGSLAGVALGRRRPRSAA